MSNVFVAISAIGNDYGIFSYSERFNQLIETIQSIKQYAPDSDIIVCEISEERLPESDLQFLESIVNKVIYNNDDKYVTFLKYNSKDPSPNKFEKKTVGEIQATIKLLEYLQKQNKKYKRVFKIAGRYKLNENFNLKDYENETRCVFTEKENWFGKMVFLIRLWSFDYKQLNTILELFYNIQQYTYNLVTQTKELEIIEYTLTQFIEKNNIPHTTFKRTGVSGLSGLNATIINE
jgi:hypothetical protein